jgi:LmbE family N-acetylglucosaminyl deacetylase
MATLVCFHAHPDDEVISTGGTIARAAAEGHRVVLVVATNGEHGEVPDDLGPDETLADRRRAETEASARVLGVARVVWLGYTDSGMTGWDQNGHPDSFHRADPDEAGARLAEVLRRNPPTCSPSTTGTATTDIPTTSPYIGSVSPLRGRSRRCACSKRR